jgi:transposase
MHLIEMVKNCEKIILLQNQDKREAQLVYYVLIENYVRDCGLQAHELARDAYLAMSTMEMELAEAKKLRKNEERRIRSKILEEYDSLVNELVREISILRNRFHEYQIGNFNEIMNIISESKKEQLVIMANDDSLDEAMKKVIRTIQNHDQQIDALRKQNFELRMTVLKIRSMFSMREQGARSYFQSQVLLALI